MRLFKHDLDKELYGIDSLTEDQLIALYNICLNYKVYVEQILTFKDEQLLAFAPGVSAKEVRENLRLQIITCNQYIDMWNKTINADAKQDKNGN